MRLILALLLGLLATVADCTPSSTPVPQTGEPGPSLVGPVPSERPFPTPTIEVPPPIN